MKILAVDDRPENVLLLKKVLGAAGHQVVGAESAEAALALIETDWPDLVLMDLRLPGGMTGFEATRIIRTLPRGRELPVIAVTASATSMDESRIRSAGFDGFLLKPIDVAALPEQVVGYIKSRGSC